MKKLLITFTFIATLLSFAPKTYAAPSFCLPFNATTSATAIPASQTNFPALIDITTTTLATTGNGGHVQNANGFDIKPYSDATCTTAISAFEYEKYNASTGELIMWYQQGTLNTSTVVYLGYGDASISTDGSASSSVWSTTYQGVWHLNQTVVTTTASFYRDSTSNVKHGTLSAASASSTTGIIGNGLKFTGGNSSERITTGYNSQPGDFTACEWYRADANLNSNERVMDKNFANGFWQGRGGATADKFGGGVREGSSPFGGFITTLTDGVWHHLCISRSGTTRTNYGDGVNGASGTVTSTILDTTSLTFPGPSGGSLIRGMIDEVQFTDTALSDNWIKTSYWNQFATSTFWTVGAEASLATVPSTFTARSIAKNIKVASCIFK